MTLNEYQKHNKQKYAPAKSLSAEQARILNWSTGLAGEVGEVAELLKHEIFYDQPVSKMEYAKELGDILWYLSALSDSLGIKLDDVLELNFAKLNHRYKGDFDMESNKNRHAKEHKFEETPEHSKLEHKITNGTRPINVIVVGPDGSGKTTICKELAQRTGLQYHKCNYEQEGKVELSKHLLQTQSNVIYDRFYYPDDLVYTKLKEGESTDYIDRFILFHENVAPLLQKTNSIILYVYADTATLTKRSVVWQDNYVAIEELESLRDIYEGLLMHIGIQLAVPIYQYDTTEIEPPIYKAIAEDFYLLETTSTFDGLIDRIIYNINKHTGGSTK